MNQRLPQSGAPDVLYVLDLACWMHRFWATMKGRAAHGFIDFVGRILRDQQPAFFAVCADLPLPTFRHDLAPDIYKAQRAPKDPTLLERMRWAKEMLDDVYGIRVYTNRNYEADDLIAAVTQHALADGLRVVLLALDKDLMQLVDGERVWMWDGKSQVWGPDEVMQKFGVRPDQLRDYLALVGDTSDNIPGVTGLGPKAAVEILHAFGTLAEAVKQALGVKATGLYKHRPRYRSLLREYAEQAMLCQKLVTLAADAPLPYDRQELSRA